MNGYQRLVSSTTILFLMITVLLVPTVVAGNFTVPHQLESSGKVVVCHNPGKIYQQTLEIDQADLADHLGHGDLEGPCAPLQETVIYECSTTDVGYEVLYVSSDSGGAQKGTVENPFGSVSSALQYAEKNNFPGVELQIKPGEIAMM